MFVTSLPRPSTSAQRRERTADSCLSVVHRNAALRSSPPSLLRFDFPTFFKASSQFFFSFALSSFASNYTLTYYPADKPFWPLALPVALLFLIRRVLQPLVLRSLAFSRSLTLSPARCPWLSRLASPLRVSESHHLPTVVTTCLCRGGISRKLLCSLGALRHTAGEHNHQLA